MKGKGDWLLIALLLAILGEGRASPAPRPGPGPSPQPSGGGARPKVKSWNGSAEEWVRDRHRVAQAMLEDKLGAASMMYDADEIARSIVAHWAIETNWGASEFNFNLGGIHSSPGQAYFMAKDAGVTVGFVAYDSVEDGAKGYGELVWNRYRDCAMKLAADPEKPDWYLCLGAKGYYGKNPNAAKLITDARARVASILGGA